MVIIAVCLIVWFLTIAHETAHALASVLVGATPKRIWYGTGPAKSFKLGKTVVSFGVIFVSGCVEHDQEFVDLTWKRKVLIVLAGPLANLLIGAVFAQMAGYDPSVVLSTCLKFVVDMHLFMLSLIPEVSYSSLEILSTLYGQIAFTSFLMGAYNLFPIGVNDGGQFVLYASEPVLGLKVNKLFYKVIRWGANIDMYYIAIFLGAAFYKLVS